MTVFEGFSGVNSMKAASAQRDRVDQMERKAFSGIEALVDKCYNEMMKSREQMTSLDSSLSFANEFLRVRQKAFQEGLATSTDLVDAQLNLSQVKIERLKALYEYDVALARLLEVCGISEQFETFRNAANAEVER
jgi:outer membrane protein TolC